MLIDKLEGKYMNYFAVRFASVAVLGLSSALFTLHAQAQASPEVEACPAGKTGQVSVVNKHLMRDGKPWIPHGFYQVPFEVPPTAFSIELPFWKGAYQGFKSEEYAEMKAQGADSVRLQIAQDGADPDNKRFYDPTWFKQALGAICSARATGLTVIVSIQDEVQTGVKTKAPLPDDATRRVWTILAPAFAHDRGVLYELYNEPNDLPEPEAANPNNDQPPTAEQWQSWAAAMNETIGTVRHAGATNVVVADGLVSAQQLSGAPQLEDELRQFIYAAHPYVSGSQKVADYNQTEQAWNEKFGDFAKENPVIISEWGTSFFCDENTPASVVKFFNYLNDRGIGIEAGIWDFDAPGFNNLTHGFPNKVEFTSFYDAGGKTCTLNNAPPNYGPGKAIETWYKTGTPPTTPQ